MSGDPLIEYGYEAGRLVPIAREDQPPELELIADLTEAGAQFASVRRAVEIVSDWMDRHQLRKCGDEKTSLDRRLFLQKLLAVLTAGGPLAAWKRANVIAHCLKLGSHKTAREAAQELGISEGRFSQLKKAILEAIKE
ncbi:MAG: hypothetical protein ABSE16_06035 [Verrucomicrobiota bacterium]|jgi:DNA-directed RNA polymerase specialized sigma subunit